MSLKAGDRVRIHIPPENLKFDSDRVYPDEGTGTAIDYVDKRGVNHGCINEQRMALIKLDVPFKRTALLGDDDEDSGEKSKKPKFKMMSQMRVPTWGDWIEILEPEK